MPPPMPNPAKRMTANPARPIARYRPGKTVQEESTSEEDESEEDAEKQPPKKQSQPQASSFPARAQRHQVPSQQTREDESADEEGFVTEEDDGDGLKNALPAAAARDTAPLGTAETPSEESAEDDETEESEEASSEEEESSSEEECQRKFQRPTFIRKSDRVKTTASAANGSRSAGTNGVISTLADADTAEADEARRKDMADLMIKDKLERDAAARAAGRKGWDDDDEITGEDVIDDTDGVDPEAEYAAWKLRELKRLKRDREAIEQREKEIEEVERRRNLTQAERETEDREYIEHQKEEREEGRGKAGFLQRYHHKGAFFQDDETAEILRKRDLMGAKFVDEVQNREALPQYMQVRDMTKLGKKGRTRYTDLRGEDTGNWAQGYDGRERKGPEMDFGVDERFKPDHDGGAKGPTGANASVVRDRREIRIDGAPDGPRALRNGEQSTKSNEPRDSHQPRRRPQEGDDDSDQRAGRRSSLPRRKSRSRRSRSRSTGKYGDRFEDEHSKSRRKRIPSPDRGGDKRRRVEAS
jgi:microfibrillar-associated protein 1